MAYTAVIEARREADGQFKALEEALRIKREKDRLEAQQKLESSPAKTGNQNGR